MNQFVKIRYQNSCDVGGTIFNVPNNSFWYFVFLPVDIGNNNYELVDDGREDGEKNFVTDFRKLQKKYTFTTVVPEFLFDALMHVQLHDTIFITTRYNEESRAFNFTVRLTDWVTPNVAQITVEFTVDYATKYGCCSNEKQVYVPCVGCYSGDPKVIDIISSNSTMFTNPMADIMPQGGRYLVLDSTATTERYSFCQINFVLIGRLTIGKWTCGVFTINSAKGSIKHLCFSLSRIPYKMFWDGAYWQKFLMLKSVVNSATKILVKGYVLSNTWVQLEISTDGVNFANHGSVTNGEVFAKTGILTSALTVGVTYYFRFELFDNNCNYGSSDVMSIVKT